MINRTTHGTGRATVLIICVAALVLLMSGCTTIYALMPSNNDQGTPITPMYDQRAVTQTKGGIAVTVGSPGPTQTFLNFGILIANYKDSPIQVKFDDVKIVANGRTLPLRTLSELQADISRIQKLEAWAGGLGAASASLAQSNAQMAASATAKSEGRALTQQLVEQHKTPAGLLAEANNALIQASNALANKKAADLAVQSSEMAWRESNLIRWDLNHQFTLGQMKTQEHFYWRTETIAPGQSVLRSIYVHSEAWSVEEIAKDGNQVDIEIKIGKLVFPYRVLLQPLTIGESSSEIQAWAKRNAGHIVP